MRFQPFHFAGKLFEERNGGGVEESMDCVNAQPVEVVIAQPHDGVVAEQAADLAAPGAIQVYSGSPWSGVAGREVRAETAEVITGRAEVVVDDVQQHGEPDCVARVDETLQGVRTAVRVMGRE